MDAVDEDGDRFLRAVCGEAGVEVVEAGVRTPDAVLLLALVGVPAAMSVVLERWHDRLRGGQIIDLRPGAARVACRDPDLIFGLVVIFAVDGNATISLHEPKSQTLELVQSVLDALGGLVGASIGAVRKKAAEVVGDQGAITAGAPGDAAPGAVDDAGSAQP